MSILLLADHDLGRLAPSTPRLAAALSALGPLDILVAGDAAVAAEAALLPGVSRVRLAPGLSPELAAPLAETLAALAPGYTHIAATANAVGRDVIPRLAARLDLMPVTDVVALHGPARFSRPIYAGNAIETVSSTQARQLLTLRPSAFPPAPMASGAPAPVEPVAPEASPAAAAAFITALRTQSDTPDLASARIVVGGGVSVGSREGFALVERLAARLGAAVGATRAAVDAGYAPNDWQVGQSGKIIAPELYIAVGVSGALQHIAGIQGAKRIVALNTDPEAPLVAMADYALIGDLFETVPALIAELERLGVQA